MSKETRTGGHKVDIMLNLALRWHCDLGKWPGLCGSRCGTQHFRTRGDSEDTNGKGTLTSVTGLQRSLLPCPHPGRGRGDGGDHQVRAVCVLKGIATTMTWRQWAPARDVEGGAQVLELTLRGPWWPQNHHHLRCVKGHFCPMRLEMAHLRTTFLANQQALCVSGSTEKTLLFISGFFCVQFPVSNSI